MNIILCATTKALQGAMARKMIPTGINLINLNTLDEVFASIPIQARICFIDDSDIGAKDVLEMVKKIKQDEKKQGARIVLLTKSADTDMIKTFVQSGVDTVFQSSLHYETVVERFLSFLKKLNDQHSQRKYIRIKPDKEDDATLKFLSPATNTYILGNITDVSMGGVAVSFSMGDIENIKQGVIYNNAQIILSKKTILIDLQVVKKGGLLAAFSFAKIRTTFKDYLSEYIFNKTQTNLINLTHKTEGKPEEAKIDLIETEKNSETDEIKETIDSKKTAL